VPAGNSRLRLRGCTAPGAPRGKSDARAARLLAADNHGLRGFFHFQPGRSACLVAAAPLPLQAESHSLEKYVKEGKITKLNILILNSLRRKTFFTTECERRVKEVKEGPVMGCLSV
jgi:hypothetical protein